MRIEIITNPRSGRGRGPARAAAIAAELVRRGHRPRIHAGRDRDDAARWAAAAAAAAGPDGRLVVVGGDGSLNAVLAGLPERDCPPLALCPLGTGNVLATDLGLTGDPLETVELIERGRVQPLDLGRVGSRRCFMVVGFGFDGELMKRLEQRRRGPMSKLAYLPLVWSTLRGWRPAPQRVVADGEDLGEFHLGFVSNVRHYGTPLLRLAAGARDDGCWELYLLERAHLIHGVRAALAAAVGGAHRSPLVTFRRVRRLEVTGDTPAQVQVDGDHHGATPLEFRVLPWRLPLLAPQP
ncbi:MAG: hypothetical protein D6702_12125 [Planctomycetota bacterium]|nr:MAG: hypothetical protein D6702_12125 [Planctomycetota bacterium]